VEGFGLRVAVDTGGTFTDLVLDEGGTLRLFKSPTTPRDPVRGVLDVLGVAADSLDIDLSELLGRVELFVHGTTHATNAVLTHTTGKTAFLTTQGHPDVLLFREGGRVRPFDFTRRYPDPYIPRALTFEVPERIGSAGELVTPLDEGATADLIARLAEHQIEAVAVCLLWSTVNPAHELRVGELLDAHLPGVPYTLSHALNPSLREYRRAASAAIDASLKPLMTRYLASLEARLRDAGFAGRLLVVTASGGVLDAETMAAAPIHSINSGPSMAPVAGRYYAGRDAGAETAVIADTGGTSYDVGLVRHGRIPWTRESWLGRQYESDLTGFPSVDVKSIGAGGGSIAWVDEGGLLRVGPGSAGADPGPACYARGGVHPTVTDAAVVLGYIDPGYFLGGAIALDVQAARRALESDIGTPLSLTVEEAAIAVLRLATEHMVRAIEDITLGRGIDPRDAVLVAGGGAAGINAVAIAKRLGCARVVFPDLGAALSAVGALISDLTAEYGATFRARSDAFDLAAATAALRELDDRCRLFADGPGAGAVATRIEFAAEARYPGQVWELEVPLRGPRFETKADIDALARDFHHHHMDVFATCDRNSAIEVIGWRARVQCRLDESTEIAAAPAPTGPARLDATRRAWFAGHPDPLETTVRSFDAIAPGDEIVGPAIVESPVTTIVIDPGARAMGMAGGGVVVAVVGDRAAEASVGREVAA
jgi:N-methylhydantoinase A